jgi:hypothetical protein
MLARRSAQIRRYALLRIVGLPDHHPHALRGVAGVKPALSAGLHRSGALNRGQGAAVEGRLSSEKGSGRFDLTI